MEVLEHAHLTCHDKACIMHCLYCRALCRDQRSAPICSIHGELYIITFSVERVARSDAGEVEQGALELWPLKAQPLSQRYTKSITARYGAQGRAGSCSRTRKSALSLQGGCALRPFVVTA